MAKSPEVAQSRGIMGAVRDVYACRLPLDAGGSLVFERAVVLVLGEMLGEAPSREGLATGAATLGDATSLRWRLLSAPDLGDRLWTLWVDRAHEEEGLSWALSVRVALEAGRACATVHLGLRSLSYQLRPLRFRPAPPDLVTFLVERLDVVEDHWLLSAEPLRFADGAGVNDLVESLVDPERVLPVLVVTPGFDGVGPLVDPDELARTLLGLAHVVELETPASTLELTGSVGKHLSVVGGAARLYWPGFDLFADPEDHPLWLRGRLEESRRLPLGQELLRRLGPLAAVRLATAPLEARIRAALERARKADVVRWRLRAEAATLDAEWQEELERAWAEAEQLRSDNTELARQLAMAEDNVRALAAHQHGAVLSGAGEDEPADGGDGPASIAEAVELAAACCEHLVVLEEAHASAAEASYRQPGRLWRALRTMEEVAAAWARDELADGFHGAFAEHGVAFRSQLSVTALGKWPHQYERTYDGGRITLGPHVALGKGSPEACCRVYFYLDEDRRRFVLGHVGNHLSDSTTG